MRLVSKLTLALSISFSVIYLLSLLFVGQQEREFADALSVRHSRNLGRASATAVEDVWDTEGEVRARALLREIDSREPSIQIRWLPLNDGESLNERVTHAMATRLQRGEIIEHFGNRSENVLYTYVPLWHDGEVADLIEMRRSLEPRAEHLRSMLMSLALLALASMLGALIVTHVFGQRLIGRRVERLQEWADKVAEGDLESRVAVRSNDELDSLAQAMNSMARRMSAAREAQAQAQAQALQHAERLAMLGQLAAGVAHEIRSPLQVIAMRAELLGRRVGDAALAEQSADVIKDQVKHVHKIIDEMLGFARKKTPRRAVHDVRDVIEQALHLVRMARTNEPVSVELEADDGDRVDAEIDSEQIRQVISNLVINAMQSMPGGGRVAVLVGREVRTRPAAAPLEAEPGAPPLELPSRGPEEVVSIVVADEGAGIPADVLPHLFEPFFTTKEPGKGTGLGLSICKDIVESHDGWIEVDSEPGVGTRFQVYLPVAVATT